MNGLITNLITACLLKGDKIAIICGNCHTSYDSLHRLSNQLANYLISKQLINGNRRVVVQLSRTQYWPIVFLAILKTRVTILFMELNRFCWEIL